MRWTPLSPKLRTVGARSLGRLSTLSLRPTTPATSLAWQPGICPGLGREGKRAAEREGESPVNVHRGDSAAPRSRPLRERPKPPFPSRFRCHSPETLALTTRARGGSGAECLGRWEAVGSCWPSLEAE
ncbi:unnamed protein product, partial [Rangifer tarandus platyrhynchus]